MKIKTKDMLFLAMFAALAAVSMLIIRVDYMFLTYDPKDVFTVIAGFVFGPLYALAVAFTVAFIEMVTISATGPYGLLMNTISSAAFVCTAAVIYQKWRSLAGAVIGLIVGCVTVTCVMLLWNYIITPVYMSDTSEGVAGMRSFVASNMLLQVFLPFNLLKSSLNAAIAMILYKPVAAVLKFSSKDKTSVTEFIKKGRPNIGVLIASVFVILTVVLLFLILQGRI